MSQRPRSTLDVVLKVEKVAYWYFRLNGFFQIENFVVHPPQGGGQRTDADLLAVRFPYRAERLIDNPNDVMEDDVEALGLSDHLIDIAIVEVKTNQPCTLNGPWTHIEHRNVQRVLAAIGCIPPEQIANIAEHIYRKGFYEGRQLRVRLVCVGRDRNPELSNRFGDVTQLVWVEMLDFIWNRLSTYKRQKTDINQWDEQGLAIKRLADRERESAAFIEIALKAMGVQDNR